MTKTKIKCVQKPPLPLQSHWQRLEVSYLVGDRVLGDVLLKANKFVYYFWRAV